MQGSLCTWRACLQWFLMCLQMDCMQGFPTWRSHWLTLFKERVRAVRNSLPFKRIPRILLIHIVLNVVKQLTFFPTKGGISESLSSRAIMKGEQLDYDKHLCLQVGEHCQVHEENTPRNSMNPRTKGAIVMGPCGNQQGGFYFMSLNSGRGLPEEHGIGCPCQILS